MDRSCVKVTWHYKGDIFVEECELVSEKDPIYTIDGVKADGIFEFWAKQGDVAFEDEECIFTLPAELIMHIEIVKEGA